MIDIFTEALPGVAVEIRPLPRDAALVLTGAPLGEMILISNYYGPTDPRPLLCIRHGIQRHDWNGKRFVCKECK